MAQQGTPNEHPPPGFLASVSRPKGPYERLRDAILDGTLTPGAPLVELAVAEWCGVSRTPVREALRRLEQDGLVERGERGLVVRTRTPEEILDIYDVRIVLEVKAARTAAERHTPVDRIRLEQRCQADADLDVSNDQMLAHANREFHRAVWQASHNESLMDLLNRLNLHLVRYPATTLSYDGRWSQALEQHRALVDAIVRSDVEDAGKIAQQHFAEARDIRLLLWQEGATTPR